MVEHALGKGTEYKIFRRLINLNYSLLSAFVLDKPNLTSPKAISFKAVNTVQKLKQYPLFG